MKQARVCVMAYFHMWQWVNHSESELHFFHTDFTKPRTCCMRVRKISLSFATKVVPTSASGCRRRTSSCETWISVKHRWMLKPRTRP